MSYTIKIRSKRHAAQLRKFVKRKDMLDDTTSGGIWKVGNYVHLWFNLTPRKYMVWTGGSFDVRVDTPTSLRELYATQK